MVSIATAFRDYVTDGVPSSGVWNPQKADIRSALAGVPTNVVLSITSSYTVLTTDAGSTIVATSGPGVLSYGAAGGYQTTHYNRFINTSSRRWQVVPTGAAAVYVYPGQVCEIYSNAGSGWLTSPQQRWRAEGTASLFSDRTLGNDANDGLAGGSSAKQSLTAAYSDMVRLFDLVNSFATLTAKGTFTEQLSVTETITTIPLLLITGTFPGGFIWKASGACITHGDLAICQVQNAVLDSSGVNNQTGVNGHQQGVMDWLGGNTFGPFPASAGTSYHIIQDRAHVWGTSTAGYKVSGGATAHSNSGPDCVMLFTPGPIVFVGAAASITVGTWHQTTGSGCSITYAGAITFTNTAALVAGCVQFTADFNSTIQLTGTTLPGSVAGTTAHGAQVA